MISRNDVDKLLSETLERKKDIAREIEISKKKNNILDTIIELCEYFNDMENKK